MKIFRHHVRIGRIAVYLEEGGAGINKLYDIISMTPEEKKDLERKFTQAFLQAIGYPNQANLLDHEVPDFLLIESKLIGIEVTQIFREPGNGQFKGKESKVDGMMFLN